MHIKILTLQSYFFREIGQSCFLSSNGAERFLEVLHKFLEEFQNSQVQPILAFWLNKDVFVCHVYLMPLERQMWSTQKPYSFYKVWLHCMDLMLIVNVILNCIVASFFHCWLFCSINPWFRIFSSVLIYFAAWFQDFYTGT